MTGALVVVVPRSKPARTIEELIKVPGVTIWVKVAADAVDDLERDPLVDAALSKGCYVICECERLADAEEIRHRIKAQNR